MRFPLILGVAALTSVGAYLYGRKVLRLSNRDLSAVWRTMLECVGLGLVFFALQLAIVFTGILVSRVVGKTFISLYEVSDITLPIFSLFQGIMFQLWRRNTHQCG